jgi:hypothetical protein
MNKPVSAILSNLIVLAEEFVVKPRIVLGSAALHQRLMSIGEDVRAADARLQEGGPTTAAGMVMVSALEQYLQADEPLRGMWLIVAGALLPLLRTETFKAITNERTARASS